jgi:hypothetical protein
MRKILLTMTLVALAATSQAQRVERPERRAFSNLGVSLNSGLTGAGLTLSTPIGRNFTARAGFGILPYTFPLDYIIEDPVKDRQGNYVQLPPIKIKAKLHVPETHLLVDYTPFKQGWGGFHLTAGLYAGGSNLIHVNGSIDLDELDRLDIDWRSEKENIFFDIGDARVRPADDGTLDAYAKVNPVRPYFGIGFGNAIPLNRVGFRVDVGALYQGKPTLTSPTMTGEIGNSSEDANDVNMILDYAKFWPQIQMSITVRLFKHKENR